MRRECPINDIFFHDREELPLGYLAREVDVAHRLDVIVGMGVVEAAVVGLKADRMAQRVKDGHGRAGDGHRVKDRPEACGDLVGLDHAIGGGLAVRFVRVDVRRGNQALDARLEGQVLLQPELFAGSAAVPAGQIPAGLGQVAGAGEFQHVGRIKQHQSIVVIAAVPADDRQAPGHVEVVTVGEGGETVLTLRDREIVRPDVAHAKLRNFPRRIHEAELPPRKVAPPGDMVGVLRVDLPVAKRLDAECALVTAYLAGQPVRGHLARGGVLPPGQTGFVVKVNAGHVRAGAVGQCLPDNPDSAAANNVRIRPVALGSQVHLVSAAHRATPHEVHPRADEIRLLVTGVMSVEKVETQRVFALGELMLALGPAPVDQAVGTAADVAEHVGRRPGRRTVNGSGDSIAAGPEQPGVEVQVLCSRRSGPDRGHSRNGQIKTQLAAIVPRDRQHQRTGGQGLLGASHHNQMDGLVCLVGRSPQWKRQVGLPGRGNCPGQQENGANDQQCRPRLQKAAFRRASNHISVSLVCIRVHEGGAWPAILPGLLSTLNAIAQR